MFTVYGALGWEWRWISITWSHPRRLDREGDVPILGSKNGQGLPVPLWFLPWKEQVVELKRMVSILYLQKPHVHIWLPRNGKVIIIGMFIYIPYFKCPLNPQLHYSPGLDRSCEVSVILIQHLKHIILCDKPTLESTWLVNSNYMYPPEYLSSRDTKTLTGHLINNTNQ